MNKLQILDCTLRDGGYVNDWNFGIDSINSIISSISKSGVDLIEVGFFRDETYRQDRSIFNNTNQVYDLCNKYKVENLLYAGLIEMANPFPIEKVDNFKFGAPHAIRYSFWKRLIDDAYDYCASIKEKGYKLCCQPTRVEQYSYSEFADMCKNFSKLKPYAVYIVDTFGLLEKEKLLEYAKIANDSLDDNIILGYHAHNNMNQAFENACAFIKEDYYGRVIQIDATVGGIGRGAGNLKLESILSYLNTEYNMNYNIKPVVDLLNNTILPIKKSFPWGYDEIFHIVAENSCNPNYAIYFKEKGMLPSQVSSVISHIQGSDKYLYDDKKAEKFSEIGDYLNEHK